MALFYNNVWKAQSFPFLSQLLFSQESNSTQYVKFNQSAILDDSGVVNETLLMEQGVPYLSATFASYVLTQNLAITATITHLILYNWEDLKSAWSFASFENLKKLFRRDTWIFWRTEKAPEPTEEELAAMDPHYRLMLKYDECPTWWYGSVFVIATVVGLICIQMSESGMAWWAFFVAVILAAVMILFTGAQVGLTGFRVPVQPIIQMIGAYLEPGRPLTNMYFTLFGYNSVSQGILLLQDLKLGQYAKLSPKCTFTMQMIGTLVGSLLNYIIMVTITDAQREILLSIEGTHIWSGAVSAIRSWRFSVTNWE
jgi:OPT family oligopeptide transporter